MRGWSADRPKILRKAVNPLIRMEGCMRKMPIDEQPRGRPGPEPEHLKIDAPWEEAVKQALRKKPPAGWPKPGEEPKEKGGKI